MEYRSSSQAFKFNLLTIIQLTKIINKKGEINVEELAGITGMGLPKVRENIQYMRFCDILGSNKISKFGISILKLLKAPNIIEQLMLYKLSRGCVNGGHYYFSRLMNQVLYDYAFQINNVASQDSIIQKAVMCEVEKEFSKDGKQTKEKNYKQALNQGLCDNTTGFGKMGMVVYKDGLYEVSGYIPHKLVTAYIFYDNWPKSRAALKIDELPTKDYFPAKIFFMGQDLLNKQIHHLVEDRILYLEQEAGLNQIRLSPELDADKILDRIVETCISN